ncbi:MAG: DMT family transporter [Actinobacteria bacterium]|nr:DMT family transporter [Actinomycetota bacterium]NDE53089.1 DMT family transporter [Actinomycetota bacterium]
MKLAPWALLAVAAMWGISFVWMKDILDQQDVYSFLTSRFIVAAAAMIALRPSVLKRFTKELVMKGLMIGMALGSGYIFQTLGLDRTTPAITGFITGLYVVFTPLLASIFLKERLTKAMWGYVFLAVLGLGILSVEGWSVGLGEIFVLISAVLFAIHIILLGSWSKNFDAYALTVMQLIGCALLASIPASINGFVAPPDTHVWAVIIFTALFATAIAFVIQTWSQARISTTKVAVILTMEVVFAALFSFMYGMEPFTLRLALGGTLVLIAMLAIVQPRVPSSSQS